MKPLPLLIASAKRELAIRKHVYPGFVERKKMTADQCRYEIECMEDIVTLLESTEDPRQPSLFAGDPNPDHQPAANVLPLPST